MSNRVAHESYISKNFLFLMIRNLNVERFFNFDGVNQMEQWRSDDLILVSLRK